MKRVVITLLFAFIVNQLTLLALNKNHTFSKESKRKIIEFNRLLTEDNFDAVEKFCDKLKGDLQIYCFQKLGNAYVEKSNFSKAIYYYEKVNDKAGINKIASLMIEKEKIPEAIKYFSKGEYSSIRAQGYARIADYFQYKEKNIPQAKIYYNMAIQEFEFLIKDYYYQWNRTDSDERIRCKKALKMLGGSENDQEMVLKPILAKAANYCKRMRKNFYQFFCQEVITEYRNNSMEIQAKKHNNLVNRSIGKFRSSMIRPVEKNYIYEYQLLKENNENVEYRTLIKRNGVKQNKPNATLCTQNRYEMLIFGPIAFLSSRWQKYFDFKILRDDTFEGEKVLVIEAIPTKFRSLNCIVGNIWIKDSKGEEIDIVKLEWNPKTLIKNFEETRQKEQYFKAKLDMTCYAEFSIKREGYRLPSRYLIEETYIMKNKKKFVRTRTEAIFKNHRYFMVNSEVVSNN